MTVASNYAPIREHSGSLGSALLLAPPLTLVGVALCSVAYGYIQVYNPIVGFVSVLLVLGFGAAIGAVAAFSCRIAACRNVTFVKALAGVSGIAALYLSWAVFEYALIRRSDQTLPVNLLGLVATPRAVFGIAQRINASGWYSISSWAPAGAVLWVLWALEGVAVPSISLATAAGVFNGSLFCESCHRWCRSSGVRKAARLTFPESAESFHALRGGDLSVLDPLDRAPDSASKVIRAETWHCAGCGQTAAVRVAVLAIGVDKSGKRSEQSAQVTGILVTTPERVAAINAKRRHQ